MGIVNDVFALASAGYGSTANALEILSYYKAEDDTTVWTDIVKNLAQLSSVMYKEDEVGGGGGGLVDDGHIRRMR